MIPTLLTMLAVLVPIIGGMAVLRTLHDRGFPGELSRKAMHLLSGGVALSFPWIFHELWPVMTLCGVSLGVMLVARAVPALRGRIAPVVERVERSTLGEIYLPIGIGATWWISAGDRLLYVVPVSILTFADAAAALVGTRFGRRRYLTSEGYKTVEGSLAFLGVGFVATAMCLAVLRHDVDPERRLLISLLLGCVLLMFEGIAWRGLDNLVVPIVAFAVLRVYLPLSAPELWARLAVLGSIGAAVLVARRRLALIGEGVLGAALYLYGAAALGGLFWLLPPLGVAAAAMAVPRSKEVEAQGLHGSGAVAALAMPGLACLLSHVIRGVDLLLPYCAGFAAGVSIVVLTRRHGDWSRRPAFGLGAAAAAAGAAIIAPVYFASTSGTAWWLAGAILMASAATGVAVSCVPRRSPRYGRLWLQRGIGVGAASCVGLLGISA